MKEKPMDLLHNMIGVRFSSYRYFMNCLKRAIRVNGFLTALHHCHTTQTTQVCDLWMMKSIPSRCQVRFNPDVFIKTSHNLANNHPNVIVSILPA